MPVWFSFSYLLFLRGTVSGGGKSTHLSCPGSVPGSRYCKCSAGISVTLRRPTLCCPLGQKKGRLPLFSSSYTSCTYPSWPSLTRIATLPSRSESVMPAPWLKLGPTGISHLPSAAISNNAAVSVTCIGIFLSFSGICKTRSCRVISRLGIQLGRLFSSPTSCSWVRID